MSDEMPADAQGSMIVFGAKSIRRQWVDDRWFVSVVDALTDSENARDYWYRMKQREEESSGIQFSTFCRQLNLKPADGKRYKTECADTEGAFRIIQLIPSPKAKPFKRRLAEAIRKLLQA
jgi:DNA-damage-inducible protein D